MTKAAAAPDGVTEVQDDEGRRARIERDPRYPGAKRIRLDATEEKVSYHTQWILPATSERPAFYPPDVPFIPDLACRVLEAQKRIHVTWRDEACPVIDPEKKEQMVESMPPSLHVIVESMKRRAEDKNTGEAARTAGFEELRERLGDKEVQEWMAAVAKAAEPDPRFVAGFETVTRVCLEERWLEEPQGETVPYAVRAVSFRRGDICRVFVLSSMMGVSSISMTQEQAKSADSA